MSGRTTVHHEGTKNTMGTKHALYKTSFVYFEIFETS
jgi:hypothetical protein